jgi:hypothetical protein
MDARAVQGGGGGHWMNGRFLRGFFRAISFLGLLSFGLAPLARAQEGQQRKPPVRGPMLDQGTIDLDTPDFSVTLVKSSQTVAALKPKGANGFDFTPGDLLVARSKDGFYHLGDIDLRLRVGDSGEWKDYSTAHSRTPVISRGLWTRSGDEMKFSATQQKPPNAQGSDHVLADADLSPSFGADIPLQVTREWRIDRRQLVMRFTLLNLSSQPVQVGALGIAMVFNNDMNERTLDEAHAKCVFYDPYIGEDAGYLQVTRLNGRGPVLLVVPDGSTPFEAYKPLLNPPWGRNKTPRVPVFTDPTPRGVTFEGFYDWMVYSQAFAENEWKNAQPWNPPTMTTIAPNQMKIYAVRFILSDSIRDVEKTLAANHRPVAVGVPGYILPTDMEGRLFLNYSNAVRSFAVEPPEAISIDRGAPASPGWQTFTLRGAKWGRARLTITYSDGLVQTIPYFVMKPESEAVADLGNFLMTRQWFVDPSDPFHRSPSLITYDRDLQQQVTQDARAWIGGLSDEGGAGSWLAAAMKEFGEPKKDELDRYVQFVDEVLWGRLQNADGEYAYGVKKSLFYYQPDELPANFYRSDIDWKNWWSWNKKAASQVDRSYDYPHVAAAYWVLYRLARYHKGLVTNHPWEWYLKQSYETSMGMTKYAGGLAEFGQMEGDIFVQILLDLQREGMKTEADTLEAAMRHRADKWKEQAYPYGSEMPWDSTGQEEVYAWMRYFGYQDKAEVTLNAILGYDPTVPSWGYNGSARRYWDFIYGGKSGPTSRLERQLHHYGSGLNAIPLLYEYRLHPDDFYSLRVGYGGTMGPLTDIDQEGYAGTAWHGFPDLLKVDGITGDYGPNFFGHAWDTATYIVKHPDFGWVVFGGNVETHGETVDVTPLDSFRMRVYLAPVGLWLTLDAGEFDKVEFNSKGGVVRLGLAGATPSTPKAYLRVEQPAKLNGVGTYNPGESVRQARGDFEIRLHKGTTWVELTAKQ